MRQKENTRTTFRRGLYRWEISPRFSVATCAGENQYCDGEMKRVDGAANGRVDEGVVWKKHGSNYENHIFKGLYKREIWLRFTRSTCAGALKKWKAKAK
jgi:hypothetical protein